MALLFKQTDHQSFIDLIKLCLIVASGYTPAVRLSPKALGFNEDGVRIFCEALPSITG